MKTYDEEEFARMRDRMVAVQLARRDITDQRILAAMKTVPRHRFVPRELRASAYEDRPLSIGLDQTISQPYVVALMTQLADAKPDAIALDVGTGSGYQAAVLAELCHQVYSVEILPQLAESAEHRLHELGYANVRLKCGDANLGWAEFAPFDVIIAAAAPIEIPQPLIDQLNVGGKLVIPVGGRGYQDLVVVEKNAGGHIKKNNYGAVAFVPMTGNPI